MKRKTKGMLAAAAALMCIFVASGCGKSGGESDTANPASSGSGETAAQNSNSGAETIEKYIVMDGSRINVLTNKGNVYYIGGGLNFSKDDVAVETPTKFLENISFIPGNGSTWIDKNGDLYINGIDPIKGGAVDAPKKLGGNIVVSTPYLMGIVAVDKDGNLYSYGQAKYNGFDKDYAELTKIDSIKDVVKVTSDHKNRFFLALTKDGTAYSKAADEDFKKVMDNVKDIQGNYIITKDDVMYYSGKQPEKIGQGLKLSKYVDPRSAVFVENQTIARLDWNGKPLKADKEIDTLYGYYPKDIKEVLYHDISSNPKKESIKILKMVYENTNGEIVLYGVNDCYKETGKVETNTKVTKSVEDISKIWEFIKASKK